MSHLRAKKCVGFIYKVHPCLCVIPLFFFCRMLGPVVTSLELALVNLQMVSF